MFRHSEMYSLLREQQILKENGETTKISPSSTSFYPGTDVAKESDNEEEYKKFLETERDNYDSSNEEEHRVEHLESKRTNSNMSRKRKISKVDRNNLNDKPPTHRRLARELDDATAQTDVLNYDEEQPSLTNSPKTATGIEAHNKHKQNNSEPVTSYHSSKIDARSTNEPLSCSDQQNMTTVRPQFGVHQIDAVYNALRDWRNRVGPAIIAESTSAEGSNMEAFLSQACMEQIAECANSLHSVEDFHAAAIHWNKELVDKYAEELISIITETLEALRQPVQGRKIWWPRIGN